jgi:Reverse transcriptase (RNA-dependent DNA polymerase)
MQDHFRLAVENIGTLGDTDVFPLPIDNHVLYDRADDAVALLLELHGDFDAALLDDPPANVSSIAMVGHTAFRWATQIDPLWNAYLLGLVLSIAPAIESARIPRDQQVVYSYRFDHQPGTTKLFADSGWQEFNTRSSEMAEAHSHVTLCDISDFYARIYHHRLENALARLQISSDVPGRIAKLLSQISGGTSYGLPVGGPAARLLSELLLNSVDRLLIAEGVTFCRYADDYHLFSDSREDAYEALLLLTEKLLQNEGLTLQRAKTRILTAKDFLTLSELAGSTEERLEKEMSATTRRADPLASGPESPESEFEGPRGVGSFLSLSLRYDPYSDTADEDYENLKEQIYKFDIIGMLAKELAKSRIQSSLTRRLLVALRYLDDTAKESAARSLIENIETLAPVFPSVVRVLIKILDDLSQETRDVIGMDFRDMISQQRYYAMVPVNLGYSVRLLGNLGKNDDTVQLFATLFDSVPAFAQRDIVLTMGRWGITWWLSDRKSKFHRMHPWVRRAYLVSSYSLGDEGKHWRSHLVKGMDRYEILVRDWTTSRIASKSWEIPL